MTSKRFDGKTDTLRIRSKQLLQNAERLSLTVGCAHPKFQPAASAGEGKLQTRTCGALSCPAWRRRA